MKPTDKLYINGGFLWPNENPIAVDNRVVEWRGDFGGYHINVSMTDNNNIVTVIVFKFSERIIETILNNPTSDQVCETIQRSIANYIQNNKQIENWALYNDPYREE
jgi:hypothetical protein